jgi:hypothetical protein
MRSLVLSLLLGLASLGVLAATPQKAEAYWYYNPYGAYYAPYYWNSRYYANPYGYGWYYNRYNPYTNNYSYWYRNYPWWY